MNRKHKLEDLFPEVRLKRRCRRRIDSKEVQDWLIAYGLVAAVVGCIWFLLWCWGASSLRAALEN